MPGRLISRPVSEAGQQRHDACRLPMGFVSSACLWALLFALVAGCSGCSEPRPDAEARSAKLIPTDSAGVLEAARASGARAAVVNVWATFCQPCREEFPDMMRLYENYRTKGLRLLLVSADFSDQAEQAKAFLRSQGVTFDTYIKQEKDGAFIDGLDPRWSGAIPATWVFDTEGKVVDFWEGKATYEQFERALLKALGTDTNG